MNGSDANGQAIKQQQQQQQAVLGATGQINSAFSGYNPQFFQNYQNAYERAGEPQLQDQYQTAAQQAQYGLANRGLLNSGAAQQTDNALNTSYNQGQATLGGSAISAAQQLQQQIAQQKSNLISQASVASDPGAVGTSAFGIAGGFQSPNAYQPLGNMFQNFGNTFLAGRLANTYGTASPQGLGGLSGGANPSSLGNNFGITYQS